MMLTMQDAVLWFGSAASAREFFERDVRRQARVDGEGIQAFWDDDDDDDEPVRFSRYAQFVQTYEDVAVVSVSGPLGYKESSWSRYFGDMTYETLANTLAAIVSDGGIKHVVLDIDSPGGMAKGTSLASEAIHATIASGIDVTAHTTGDMCSAAYWIGSAASKVYAAKNAEVGSIGVLLVHQEVTKLLDKIGIQVTVLRKGEEKALGSPYEPLDDKAKASIDDRLERAYTSFIDHVAAERSLDSDFVRNSIATGRVFSASEAQSLGLIDGIQGFNQLINALLPTPSPNSLTGATAMSKTPILSAVPPAGLASETPTPPAAAAPPEDTSFADLVDAIAASTEEAPKETRPAENEPAGTEVTEPKATAPDFTAMLSDLTSQLVSAKVSLEQATTERDALKAGNAGLRQAVIEQVQTLRIRLGQSAGSDLETMSDSALVAAYQAVKADFTKRFKPGPVSAVPEKDPPLPSAAVTRLDLAVRKATSIGK